MILLIFPAPQKSKFKPQINFLKNIFWNFSFGTVLERYISQADLNLKLQNKSLKKTG